MWNVGAFLLLFSYGQELTDFEEIVKEINLEFINHIKEQLDLFKKLAPTKKK